MIIRKTATELEKMRSSGILVYQILRKLSEMVTEGVSEVTWVATSKDSVLPDAQFDEFVFRGRVPKEAGPMWFKVFQGCEKGSTDWAEIPTSGTSTKGLKAPAALLEILPPK